MTRMTDQIGRVLGGRYRLLSPLGSGASAQVYLADDVRLRRRVAVKVLHPALADDESFLRRFRAEAQAAAAPEPPPPAGGVRLEATTTRPYLVTEYLSGGSLRALLDAGHRLTPAQALVVGLEAARALDHAHRRGFVHRDIKPANLLFGEDGRLRIADFGLAQAIAEAGWTEPTGSVLGTARYASPEQARGESLDGRSDVYSLALVLVESVTGQVPFTADTTIGTLMARLERSLRGARRARPAGGGAGGRRAARPGRPGRRRGAGAGAGGGGAGAEPARSAPAGRLGGPRGRRRRRARHDADGPGQAGGDGPAGRGGGDPETAARLLEEQGEAATHVMQATAHGDGRRRRSRAAPGVRRGGRRRRCPGPRRRGRASDEPRGLSPGDRSARRLMLGASVVVLAVVLGVVGSWAWMQANVPSHEVPAR